MWAMEKEMGMPIATHLLQHTLRSLCIESQWVYAVFWRILPRSYPPPKWDAENGIYDRSKGNKRNWILAWEDGFCDFAACGRAAMESKTGLVYEEDEFSTKGLQPELFFKMSHEVYNFGEGLIGKVAADNSHKWIFRDPLEHEVGFLSPWHNSIDPHPRTWEAQFKSGIQTIAVIAVRDGLVQLGATQKVIEDLNIVIHLQRKFNYLQTIPGVFLPHPSSQLPKATKDQSPWNEVKLAGPSTATTRSLEKCLSWTGTLMDDSHHVPSALLFNSFANNQNLLIPIAMALQPSSSTPPVVLPSMSSLEALMSKLPSVTANSSSHACCNNNNNSNNILTRTSPSLLTKSLSFPDRHSNSSGITSHDDETPFMNTQPNYALNFDEFANFHHLGLRSDHEMDARTGSTSAMDSYLSEVVD